MDPADVNLVKVLLHHINVIFISDAPENVGREKELDTIKQCTKLAERIVSGSATAGDKAAAAELVHPQVRSTFGL